MSQLYSISVAKKGLADLTARSFKTRLRGKTFQGFVVRKGDKYYAYQNLCQHLLTTLDLGDDEFLNHDKTHLQCHAHGATYEIETGLCVAGPCPGARLVSLALQEEEAHLVITIPDSFGRK